MRKDILMVEVEVKVEDGDVTRVVLQGRMTKVIKARVAKTSPSPSQQPKMILLLWTEISWTQHMTHIDVIPD